MSIVGRVAVHYALIVRAQLAAFRAFAACSFACRVSGDSVGAAFASSFGAAPDASTFSATGAAGTLCLTGALNIICLPRGGGCAWRSDGVEGGVAATTTATRATKRYR